MNKFIFATMLAGLTGCYEIKQRPTVTPAGWCTQYRNINVEGIGGCNSYGKCGVYAEIYSYEHPTSAAFPVGACTMYHPSRGSLLLDAYVCRYGAQDSIEYANYCEFKNEVPYGFVLTNPNDHTLERPCCGGPDAPPKPVK